MFWRIIIPIRIPNSKSLRFETIFQHISGSEQYAELANWITHRHLRSPVRYMFSWRLIQGMNINSLIYILFCLLILDLRILRWNMWRSGWRLRGGLCSAARVYKAATSRFVFPISCARACTVASEVLPRHSLLLIANYTSEPVCFLRDSAIFETIYHALHVSYELLQQDFLILFTSWQMSLMVELILYLFICILCGMGPSVASRDFQPGGLCTPKARTFGDEWKQYRK